jgi:hypothetical protein
VKHRLSGKTGITPAGFLQGGEGGAACEEEQAKKRRDDI